MLEFVRPQFFWLFVIIPIYIIFYIILKQKKKQGIPFGNFETLKTVVKRNSLLRFLPLLLRIILISTFIIALAKPRLAKKRQKIKGKGVDIMIVLDTSGSMQALDFKPDNRLIASKKVAEDFIKNRTNDRIGLIQFSENSFTRAPLTLDYSFLVSMLNDINITDKSKTTSLGLGLASAVGRLRKSEAKSKVVILLTDGRNNSGEIDPLTAAELAVTYDIKVYPIGVAKEGLVDYPTFDVWGRKTTTKIKSDLDMETLQKIADITGTNHAYRAENTKELDQIFKRIDKLEKSEFEIENYFEYKDLFTFFLWLGFIFLLIDILSKTIFLRELPL